MATHVASILQVREVMPGEVMDTALSPGRLVSSLRIVVHELCLKRHSFL